MVMIETPPTQVKNKTGVALRNLKSSLDLNFRIQNSEKGPGKYIVSVEFGRSAGGCWRGNFQGLWYMMSCVYLLFEPHCIFILHRAETVFLFKYF